MRKIALCLLLASRLAGAATMQGIVLDHATGRPLARAQVTVAAIGAQGGSGSQSTRANSSGQFYFSRLSVGAYLLSAARPGFATLHYGQKTWKSAGTPIFLPEQETNLVLEVRLRRLPAITGLIWDENLVGLPGQEVVAYRAGRPPRLSTKVKTDDRGVYRIGELEPGRYYVRTRGEQGEQSSGTLPTFYKDVAPLEEARPVDVDLDQQAEDINIQPAFGKLFRIAGLAPAPPRTAEVTIELLSDMGPVSGSVDAAGHFTFDQVAPGTYELTAEAVTQSGMKLGAYRKMAVDTDQEDIRLPLNPQPELSIDFEEQHGRNVDARSITVLARRKGIAGEGPARRVRSEQDPLPPGPWELSVTPPPDMYVASISTSERGDLPSPAPSNGWKPFFLAPGSTLYVKVTLSRQTAALSGRVTTSLDQAAAGAPVFLEPVELDSGVGLMSMRFLRTDLKGQYRFTALPPGRYRALSSFDFEHPDSDEMQAAQAATVSLKEGAEIHQNLTLFVAP